MPGTPLAVKISARRARFLTLAGAALVLVHAAEPPAAAPANAPWKIHQTTPAVFPPRLLHDGVTHGEARVRVSIAANGALLDALVVASSHRAFGDEALRTARAWRYEPAREHGESVGVVGDISFSFVVNGPVAIEKRLPATSAEPALPGDPPAYGAESLQRLDRIPTPTHVVPPVYPADWSDRGIAGTATVEFYVDESGRTRIPLVTAASHPLLGASAVAAVAQWRFEPPTRAGRPVLARIEQVFTFQPGKK